MHRGEIPKARNITLSALVVSNMFRKQVQKSTFSELYCFVLNTKWMFWEITIQYILSKEDAIHKNCIWCCQKLSNGPAATFAIQINQCPLQCCAVICSNNYQRISSLISIQLYFFLFKLGYNEKNRRLIIQEGNSR